MTRFGLIGPTYPFRGGIAQYTTLLTNHLREKHEMLLISFTRQYPRWLFPGRSDRDPSQFPLKTEAEYILDPVNPLSWRRTVKRLRTWSPEVVIIPWWVPYWAPAWAAVGRGVKRLPCKPKLIFICHNVLPHESSIIDKKALRLALSPADGYIVHAQQDAKLLSKFFPRTNVQISPHPTYASLGSSGNSQNIIQLPSERPLLLFFGFIRRYKGLDILLQALAILKNRPPAHLLVVGEIWEEEGFYRSLISKLDLDSRVTIVDKYVPDEELVAYVDACDVIVLPYRFATQSGVVQVAFGRQKPVITTNVGGLAEVVEDGHSGLIVPPEDPEALAHAIDRFFSEDLGPAMSANIERESERFSWSQFSKKLFELIDKLDNAHDRSLSS